MSDSVGWSIFGSGIEFADIAATDCDTSRPPDDIRPRDGGRDGLKELVVLVWGIMTCCGNGEGLFRLFVIAWCYVRNG